MAKGSGGRLGSYRYRGGSGSAGGGGSIYFLIIALILYGLTSKRTIKTK